MASYVVEKMKKMVRSANAGEELGTAGIGEAMRRARRARERRARKHGIKAVE